MIPVNQDRFGWPNGNCFEACVASVLECPLAAVPYLGAEPSTWFAELQMFLAPHGLHAMTWDAANVGDWRPPGFWIGGIKTRFGHACVFQGRDLVHNPHAPYTPETTDLGQFPLVDILVFAVLDLDNVRASTLIGSNC